MARNGRRGAGRLARVLALSRAAAIAILLGAASALLGVCGPFGDVAADAFCPFVLEIFYLGITTGTTPTTYDPSSPVSRLQMAAFLSRSVDGTLKRGSRRAALNQFWLPQAATPLNVTTVGALPGFVQSDGLDLWVSNFGGNTVSRVRGSDGRLLDTWTASAPNGILPVLGKVFVAGFDANSFTGILYMIDPRQAAGFASVVSTELGATPSQIAYDGSRVWVANEGSGSIAIVTPALSPPWTVTTVSGFTSPAGMLYDGTNTWTTDSGRLLRLDGAGVVLQTVTVGANPRIPVFDGSSIWVPNFAGNSVSVVRASSGVVLRTLTGNGLNTPITAAFDGERVLVTDFGTDRVSLWKAADMTPLGFSGTGAGTQPSGSCSDGVNFWVTLSSGKLLRF